MFKTILTFSVIGLCTPLSAQTASTKANGEEVVTRTIRVIIAGNRRLPEFKEINGKLTEVDPSLEKLPPTSFQFEDPKHAPKPAKGQKAKTRYSAWANSLITIKNYTGPSILQLELRRPLTPKHKNQTVKCDLGSSINPLIVIHPSHSSSGWRSPQSKVINIAKPTGDRGATMVNLSNLTIKATFFHKATIVKGSGHKNIVIPTTTANKINYKIQAFDPKIRQSINVANSNYRVKKKTQLVVITMPGLQTSKTKIARPNIRIIPITFK